MPANHQSSEKPTALIALADGQLFYGKGFGATGVTVAELVFNTAMTGYQEIMTDPSYAGQVVTFTFPHIGNVGVTPEDDEAGAPGAAGMVVKWDPTEPSNWRATADLVRWLEKNDRIGIGGVDTRRLTRAIRQQGAPHVAIAHSPDGVFDIEALVKKAREWKGLVGLDLAKEVTCAQSYTWNEKRWAWPEGYSKREGPGLKVVAIDYGAKRNILRCLASAGCDVTVLPASATAEDVLALNPEGVFLSNGPGDPAATGEYVVPMIQGVLAADLPAAAQVEMALGVTVAGYDGACAPEYFERAIALGMQAGDRETVACGNYLLAQAFFRLRRLVEAHAHAREAAQHVAFRPLAQQLIEEIRRTR